MPSVDANFTRKLLYPGSYSTNLFYDPQDLFDPTKTSAAFTNRMILAGNRTNSEDRYTFERLLNNIGMGSAPEYGVWVYNDLGSNTLRTKININFDNTTQIQNGPYSPMPTNLVNWTPLGFFTNAAELLVRSQAYTFTNYVNVIGTNIPVGTFQATFGLTNIPIYRVYYPGVQYNEAIHRMLQLAANIYSATVASNYASTLTTLPPVRHPFIFRPLFQVVNAGTSNWGVNIVGFTNVSDPGLAYRQMQQPYVDLTSNNVVRGYITDFIKRGANFNISGIPWVVSAEKGLPQFYQYSYNNRILFTRKALFSRHDNGGLPDTNRPPQFTNQFYVMSISNSFGIGAWNPYTNLFAGSLGSGGTTYYLSNYVTVELTNNFRYGYVTNFWYTSFPNGRTNWPAWSGVPNPNNTSGFVTLFSNNLTTIPSCYFSEALNRLIFFTNNLISSNSFLPQDTNQTGWPVHNWTLNVTNHIVYALFDGSPFGGAGGGGALLDYVNLGPFGSSVSITNQILNPNTGGLPNEFANNPWAIGAATDLPGSRMSLGLINQVNTGIQADPIYWNSLNGRSPSQGGWVFGAIFDPSNIVVQTETWVANDPFVHYTVGDLTWPVFGETYQQPNVQGGFLLTPVTNSVGGISRRYDPWGMAGGNHSTDMLFKDPMVTSASAWQFPTNKFPSVGWLGRVHRGTPWQTVYFKSDNPNRSAAFDWVSDWVNTMDTYPTNDWVLPDLFTTALNDNAARGLLSVNQTNDAAWAAVLGGVMALSNVNVAVAIDPTNVYQFVDDPTNGINAIRSTNVNGLFHKVGQILSVPALTAASPFWNNNLTSPSQVSDEVVERIPQQIMGLLKVGEPQFVIYAWGESLRPKNLYLSSPNNNLCTNYEITGEYLSRTVCHVVHTNGPPKMVIDSYNIEPAD